MDRVYGYFIGLIVGFVLTASTMTAYHAQKEDRIEELITCYGASLVVCESEIELRKCLKILIDSCDSYYEEKEHDEHTHD